MGATAQVNERLAALTAAGTSVWLDQIRRTLIEGGELQRLVEQDSLRGVTSNPAIFEKAILGSEDYDDQLRELVEEGVSGEELYLRMAVLDVQLAADVLRPVWESSGGVDGYVSLEVGPSAAHDTDVTLEQARDYSRRVGRPNVMIKIPGTTEGVPAIEQAIYEGIHVNVTLLFSVESYSNVAEAFIRGLERRHQEGKSLDIHSVASFFVSRVDSEVDKRLEELGRDDLAGTAALANARAAYQRFKEIFYGDRFAALKEAGAAVQRPLWASTGVKNPQYSETMYVDQLVAPDTVNTMPMATLHAVAERGEISGEATADRDPSAELDALAQAGIDMEEVTLKLLDDGIDAFVTPMEKLLTALESKREAIVTRRPATIESWLPEELEPAIVKRIEQATTEDVARRLWRKDESLWGGPGVPEVGNRLGWLTIAEAMAERVGDLEAFARNCSQEGLTDAVLLGMGGSSLAPEVLRQSFEQAGSGPSPNGRSAAPSGALTLHVLDSTDPGAIRAVQERVDLEKALFLVSTKSGGTIETLSLFGHFHQQVTQAVGAERAGSHFVAITDPGSSLIDLAQRHEFRRTFVNDPDIGGRYSALSLFGLVPAALMGVDLSALLDGAGVAEQASVSFDSTANNSGLWLGLTLGELARHGRDKLTFVVSEPIASFGLWAEQLVAESTGKEGKGILPVADEPLGEPDSFGSDRVFAYLRNEQDPDPEQEAAVKELIKAGHPTITLPAHGPGDLGRIFFFAEFATAVAGWVLEINPFDQPNVQEAKDNTSRVLDQFHSEGRLPEVSEADDEALRRLLADARPPDYVAIMGYVAPSEAFDEAIGELRLALREATKATTTFGYGPRFLHSTGQFHKGGPKVGRFLQLVHDGAEDLEIPGQPFTFATLKNAQATGDLQTLREHGLPAERVRLDGDDPAAALRALTERIRKLL
ncbi:MAG TPA: bifunctional transaldolase/phosoglucose isomerase [Solirubrobacteraceae bacterium]|nr:bifunctional transaldolase/phosoglucose isomerase [Solirubrobacteraceae bacterium]